MTTSTLPRLAEAATAARGGADLLRFALADSIPDTALAKNSDGSTTIAGVDLLKSGLFNGVVSVLDEDLVAMVARFDTLIEAGIFVPPFRLDHSWSVQSVIGYFERLETYERVDETDNMRKTFLRGDIRVTGSIDYKPEQILDAIKRGALRSRSSEIGYYVTNSGVELPLVFYGCAYVDIPAVEGLAPVELSKNRRPEPRSITNLTAAATKGNTMDPKKLARLKALRGMLLAKLSADEVTELDQLNDEATAAGVTDADVEASEVDPVEEGTPAPAPGTDPPVDDPTPTDPPETDPVEPVEETVDPPETPAHEPSAELTAARAEIARLRGEAASREIAHFRTAGAIVAENEEAATALLSHTDEGVRRAAGTLLGSLTSRISLGRSRGRQELNGNGNGNGKDGDLIVVGMGKDEVGALWANLTREERDQHREELDAWQRERDENGIRD